MYQHKQFIKTSLGGHRLWNIIWACSFFSLKFEEPLSAEIRGHVKRKKKWVMVTYIGSVWKRGWGFCIFNYLPSQILYLSEQGENTSKERERTSKQHCNLWGKGSICRGGHYRVALNDGVLYSLPPPQQIKSENKYLLLEYWMLSSLPHHGFTTVHLTQTPQKAPTGKLASTNSEHGIARQRTTRTVFAVDLCAHYAWNTRMTYCISQNVQHTIQTHCMRCSIQEEALF